MNCGPLTPGSWAVAGEGAEGVTMVCEEPDVMVWEEPDVEILEIGLEVTMYLYTR
jgi:coenzyme PQQ precursor peptide PqqA